MNHRIDLLPEELQSKPPVNLRRLLYIVLTMLLTVGLLAIYGLFLWDYYRVSGELARFNERLPQIKKETARLEEIKRQRLDLEKRAGELEALIRNRRTWPGMLAEIARTVPGEVWLTSLRLEEGKEKQAQKKSPADALSQTQPGQIQKSLENIQESPERPAAEEDKETKAESTSTVPGVPNTLFIEGASYSVPAVGIFTYRLGQLPYFSKVVLTDLHSEENNGYVVFTVVASLKAGAPNVEQVK
ncbi:MAG: PilN domain-containing protein [Armatimonadetes bacterium]|nr:PilN domain-containing protein [Armatimonadota bacterium]